MAAAATETPVQQMALVPCKHCNRSFTAEALTKHEPVCRAGTLKNRKQFDSHRQRMEGTEMLSVRPRPSKSLPRAQASKGNWRQQHKELVDAMRNARATKRAMDAGLPLPPPPPPSVNPDYIQCPYCLRRFNETAAERHIPFCKTKMERLPAFKSGNPTPATQRAPAQTKPTPASVRPPTVTSNPGPPQRSSVATGANGARPKTSVGEQKGAVGHGTIGHEDPTKTTRRGPASNPAKR